ncbi:MAG: alpha-L-fucosidase [Muribaculaceae bacterium]
MSKPVSTLLIMAACMGMMSCSKSEVAAPEPFGPLPTEHQLAWHQMESYAFIHFGLNTFADKEWGYGDTPASVFNPSNLDCEQWVKTIKAAGMKGVVITTKHHDGFCLWPTELTEYCIRNTPYKDGKGDLVGELRAACDKYGLELGLYLSPWDRNSPVYGTPEYVEYYHKQIEELTTRYGKLFEFWLDGANGGDGYYGGARETRQIDRRTYYDFPKIFDHILKNQPQAIIFSDGGPGCRWVGNERGVASATNWAWLRGKDVYPGYPDYTTLQYGHTDGDTWIPAECDVSIRPGWFYHESEDSRVKTPEQLVDLYYRSIGHNANFILNFPIDKTGRINPIDSANVVQYRQIIERELANNVLKGLEGKVSDTRGGKFNAKAITDDDRETYWATHDDVTQASVEFDIPKQKINRLLLQEYIALGQRVQEFTVEYRDGDQWKPVDAGEETTTIGYKRILRFPTVETDGLRITIVKAHACPCISNIEAFYGGEGSDNSFVDKGDDFNSVDFELTTLNDRFVMDLGGAREVNTLHYLPDADSGLISNYEIYAGETAETANILVKSGEFSNIQNNPVLQTLRFAPTRAKVFVLKATRMIKPGEAVKAKRLGLEVL